MRSFERPAVVPELTTACLCLLQVSKPHLRFFVVDCRQADHRRKGRLGAAFELEPSLISAASTEMSNADSKLEKVLSSIEPVIGSAHICILGDADGRGLVRALASVFVP